MGRSTFITYGDNDSGDTNSKEGVDALNTRSFPVESYEITGTTHTDEWITDVNTPVASSASYTGHPLVTDVRSRMRDWISGVISNKPGTHRISGVLTDSGGAPIAGARVQSGMTHWTFTDESGSYELDGLIDGARTVTVSHSNYQWTPDTTNVTVSGADLTGQNFTPGVQLVISNISSNGSSDLIIDFTGTANTTYGVRKTLDLCEASFSIITAQNAPVTTDGSGMGQAIINAADASGAIGFFRIMHPQQILSWREGAIQDTFD